RKNMKNKLVCISNALFIIAICVFTLTSCSIDEQPEVEEALKRDLSESFTFRYWSGTDRDKTYHFEDENGVEFSYTSAMRPIVFGGDTFGSRKNNSCDYAIAFLNHHGEEIRVLLELSGLEYEYNTDLERSYLKLSINSFEDAKMAVDVVFLLLNKYTIPIKNERSASDVFSIPRLIIYHDGTRIRSSSYEFTCVFSSEIDYEDVSDKILNNYITDVKNERIKNDLPKDINEDSLPNSIDTENAVININTK
ncbi:hypothetical protein RBH29_09790, partial [Herbivorax sp. ANBcel31]|uniref:hypothetical protein n=1 Tax=Herbivorax sp. ANBcel31 TaxID=3069754 RepID=UPI0027B2F7A3